MKAKLVGRDLIDIEAMLGMVDELMPEDVGDVREGYDFKPQPKQRELLKAAGVLEWSEGEGEVREAVASLIGYGGAAYGGKSYGMLGLAGICALAIPGVQIAYFRRTYAELEGAGSVSRDAAGVFWNVAEKREGGREWYFPATGSTFQFLHCEHEDDVNNYQSKAFDILLIDEATHFTWEMIDYLLTRNRKSTRSRIKRPFAVMSSNPGNIGHGWYMGLFDLEKMDDKVKSAHYDQVLHVLNPNGKWSDVKFIPAFLEDNKIGTERDPEYERRLLERGAETAMALRYGLWDVFTGQMFKTFSMMRHVVEPFDLPAHWPKWRAVDWGITDPFCCLWLAKDIDIGRIIVYREVYGAGMTEKQQCEMIVTYSPPEEAVSLTFADPAMWARKSKDGVVYSSADEYLNYGVPLTKADNSRVSGIQKIHGFLADRPDGKPGLHIVSTCKNLIRTLPKLSRSDTMHEDIADRQEDHAFDAFRYGLTNVRMFGERREKGQRQKNPWLELRNI